MAIKLSSFRLSKKISIWVLPNAYLSSMACPNNPQITPEIDQSQPNWSEFEGKIKILKNKLNPDSLIRVLDSTNDLGSSLKLFNWASLQRRFHHTAETYFQMILKLGMGGEVEKMEGFCKNMVKERCIGCEEALLALVDSFVRNHRLNEALRVLGTLNSCNFKPSIGVFNVLLGALAEGKKDLQDVLFVYKEMVKVGIVPNVDTLNYLVEALFDANRVDSALDQFRRMRKKACRPNSKTFEIVISGLIARDRVDESIVVLDEIFEIGCEPELSFYTRIIPSFCKMNKLEEGMRLFKLMRASNIVPDSLTYGVLIQCLCENHRIDEAISFLDEMKDINLTPPGNLIVEIVNGLCVLDKFEEAKRFLEERDFFETDSHNALLEGYSSAGNFLGAKDLFNKMVEKNITDSLSWNIIIRCFSENERIDKALEFLSRMIVSSFIPDSSTYSALIVGRCKSKELDDALELFHQVCKKDWVLDSLSYAELVKSLCQREKIQEAAEVFLYMSTKNCALSSSSFDMLIEGLCKTGNVDRAIRLFSLFDYSGSSCLKTTYKSIMVALSKLQRFKDLLIILSRMIVTGCPLDAETYCILIQSMISLSQTRDCALYINFMVSEDLLPDSETLFNLLSFLARNSQLHEILWAIDKFVTHYEVLNPSMYNLLINGLWKEGNKSEACRLLDVMLDKGWVPDAITHGLLIGSVVREEIEVESAYEKFDLQDKVSSILAEGLGKM